MIDPGVSSPALGYPPPETPLRQAAVARATAGRFMSHLVTRLGDLFHSSAIAPKVSVPATPATGVTATPTSKSPAPKCPDDLAFFSLSVERPVHDRRSDLDRLGLIELGEEPLQEI